MIYIILPIYKEEIQISFRNQIKLLFSTCVLMRLSTQSLYCQKYTIQSLCFEFGNFIVPLVKDSVSEKRETFFFSKNHQNFSTFFFFSTFSPAFSSYGVKVLVFLPFCPCFCVHHLFAPFFFVIKELGFVVLVGDVSFQW